MIKNSITEQVEELEEDCKKLGEIRKFNWKPLIFAATIFGISISGGTKK